MKTGKLIRSLREGLKLTQEQLAKRVGVSRVSISKWESGENKPKGDNSIALASALRVSVDWLLSGSERTNGEISPDSGMRYARRAKDKLHSVNDVFSTYPEPFANVEKVTLATRVIPVLSYVQAGLLTELQEISLPDGELEYVQADDDLGECAFAMRINGDSMQPEFGEGDLVIIDPDIDPIPGDYVAAKNGSDEATFKKYRPRGFNPDGVEYFELVPLNEDYAPIRSDMSEVDIIGVMVEHRKYRRRRK